MEWDELSELYGQVIIERAQDPRWFHPLKGSVQRAVVNPTCGDAFTVAVTRGSNHRGGRVHDCPGSCGGCLQSCGSPAG